jgi:hypothetical protein
MELPRCTRCEKKNITCSYPKTHNRSLSHIPIPELEFAWLDDLMGNSNTIPWNGELQPQLHATLINGTTLSGSSEDSDNIQFDDTPPEPTISYVTTTTTTTTTQEPDYLAAVVEKPTESTLPQEMITAAVDHFKKWPEKWVKEGKAPFIHPRLYTNEMPKPLQEAYAACAIFSVKTAQNENIAFTIIESKANELLRLPDQASSTPLHLLAAVQALIIFQFIRLFDGDIRQRAQAEKAEPILEAWTEQLKHRTSVEQTFTTDTSPSWRSWIFSESVRRTILMSYFLTGIYSLVKTGFCSLGGKVSASSFTAHRRFWEAKTLLEWEQARQSCSPYWISRLNFDHVFYGGGGDEIDDFGMVLLISVKGQDAVDHWVAAKSYGNQLGVETERQRSLVGMLPVEHWT